MTPPESHPNIHAHKGKGCPVTGKTHNFCPPQPGDSRSPCPALNTMANHGYINRNGKNLSAFHIARGLKACYGLTVPLSLFLSYGGFFMLRRVRPISLYEIGKHGAVEHDASLVHHNTPAGEVYAPIEIDQTLVSSLMDDARTGTETGEGAEAGEHRTLMGAIDVARARVRREKESPPLDPVHAEIARGEMGILLGVWETKTKNNVGMPIEWLRRWFSEEKLPDGWKPTRKQGLRDTIKRSKAIREAMENIRNAETEVPNATQPSLDGEKVAPPPTPRRE